MFLSNQKAAACALLIVMIAAASCSWFRSEPVALAPSAVTPPETGIPFETKEPETYQADFVTIAAGSESGSHFARKAGRWRIDTFLGEKVSRSIISSGKLVYIDHKAKEYSEPPESGLDPQPAFLADLTTSLLSERQPARFEKLGTEGSLESYSVSVERTNAPSKIVFDTTIKMVVRHEFEGGFAFEMRNFTLDVDDVIFQIPSGYRKVAWDVFKQK